MPGWDDLGRDSVRGGGGEPGFALAVPGGWGSAHGHGRADAHGRANAHGRAHGNGIARARAHGRAHRDGIAQAQGNAQAEVADRRFEGGPALTRRLPL